MLHFQANEIASGGTLERHGAFESTPKLYKQLVFGTLLTVLPSQVHNRNFQQFLLTPLADDSELPDDEAGRDAVAATPSKRGRPPAPTKKTIEKAARVLGFGAAARELTEAGIVGVESRHGDRVGRVRLGVGEEDVRSALREDEECRGFGFGFGS